MTQTCHSPVEYYLGRHGGKRDLAELEYKMCMELNREIREMVEIRRLPPGLAVEYVKRLGPETFRAAGGGGVGGL